MAQLLCTISKHQSIHVKFRHFGLSIAQILHLFIDITEKNSQVISLNHQRTRRERLKSALYLSLKKRKTFFWKKLEIFEKNFSFGKCRVVLKNVKGGTLFDL